MSDAFETKKICFGETVVYRIRVQGCISADTAESLGGMKVLAADPESPSRMTTLVGRLRDQAALSGVLNTLYELHIPILEVKVLESEESVGQSEIAPESPDGHGQ